MNESLWIGEFQGLVLSVRDIFLEKLRKVYPEKGIKDLKEDILYWFGYCTCEFEETTLTENLGEVFKEYLTEIRKEA